MSVASDLTDAIATNAATIKQYATILAADALAPKTSYTLDGESCSRNEWRKSLTDAMQALADNNEMLQKLINQQAPYAVSTRVRV